MLSVNLLLLLLVLMGPAVSGGAEMLLELLKSEQNYSHRVMTARLKTVAAARSINVNPSRNPGLW